MRPFLTFLTLIVLSPLPAQSVYAVEEILKLGERVARDGAMIYYKLPLDRDGVKVSVTDFSAPPEMVPAIEGKREFAWEADNLNGHDSLRIAYRVTMNAVPAWNLEAIRNAGVGFSWPADASGPYALPPLDLDNLSKTDFSTLEKSDTGLVDIDRLITRLDRRIVTLEDAEQLDPRRPLLEDVYRRRTSPRRKHLLLSLALQYLEIPHRLVAGKTIRYGEVYENELWLEIPVGGKFYRVYYGDNVDRSDWGEAVDPDMFLACSYDYRDYTLEVVNAPGKPPVPSILFTNSQNLLIEFWDKKNEALTAKRYGRAVGYVDSLLVYLPGSVTGITEKGLILAEAGRPEEGIGYLQHGLNSATKVEDKTFALVQLAKYYTLLGKNDEAVGALVRAYQVSRFDTNVLYTDYRFGKLVSDQASMRKLERTLYNFN